MGMTKINLVVKSLIDSRRQVEAEFLVDSGAHFTVLPYKMVRKLGLKPAYEQDFSLNVRSISAKDLQK